MNRAKKTVIYFICVLLILTVLISCESTISDGEIGTEEYSSPVVTYTESTAEPGTEPGTEPDTEFGTEPGTGPITQPVTEPVTKPVTETVYEPVTKPVTEPVKPDEYLNKTTISKYTIIYSSDSTDSAECASLLKTKIHDKAGVNLTTSGNKTTNASYKIIIGNKASANAASLGYDDFRIFTAGSIIYIDGGSKYALFNAADKLCSEILENTPYSELNFKYNAPSRDKYINDCTNLIMHWEYTWIPSEWMLKWDGKLSRLCNPSDTHVFTISHRGDFVFYPENSLESYISIYKMGGDAIEIDVQATSDGKLILMHDSTLTRMTNYLDYAGKTVNGIKFPKSSNIKDWTLEQLSYLKLKEGEGGNGAAVTPYKIPTLEEVLIFCKNRLFIILDKPANWRYVNIDGIMVNSAANYLYPLMVKTNNYTSILISYGTLSTDTQDTLNANQALQIQKYIMDNSGEKCYMYLRGWTTRGTAAPYAKTLEGASLTNSAILVNGEFDPDNTKKIADIKAIADQYKNTRLGGWTLLAASENAIVWKQMYDTGIRIIMVNKIMDLLRFTAEIK